MTATVTDDFKRVLVDQVFDDFYDSDTKYYIGIGRAQPWDFPDSDARPPFPDPSALEVRNFRDNLQTIKRVSDASHVVIRYNWTNGNIYSGWNDKYHSENIFAAGEDETDPYYVIDAKNAVYVCLKTGRDPSTGQEKNSTVPPNDRSGNPFETSDGYQWKYMYTVGTNDTRKFLTSGYIPAQQIISESDGGQSVDDLDPFQAEQLARQALAVPGEILGVEIDSAGKGFPDALTIHEIEFEGAPLIIDGVEQTIQPARAWAKSLGGKVVDVTMKNPSDDTFNFGGYYYDATLKFKSPGAASGYKLRPIIAPPKGLGAEAEVDLNSTALMFNVILIGQEDGAAIVDNDFRQIGLIRNPEQVDSDGSGTIVGQKLVDTTTALVLSSLRYNVNNIGDTLDLGKISGDEIMEGGASNARAIIDAVDDVNELFYYHQTRETGYGKFQVGETLTISTGVGTGILGSTTVMSINQNDYIKQSGAVYYIDSRRPFMRNNEQSEDIKLIIDF